MIRLSELRARIEASDVARRFLAGAAWTAAGAIAASGITLVTMIFVARILGRQTYGHLVLVQSTISMVGVFAGVGVGTTAIRYIAMLRSRDVTRLARVLAVSERALVAFAALGTVGLVVFSGRVALWIEAPHLKEALAIAAFSVFFSTLDGYQKSVLIGLEAMRAFAAASVLGALCSVPLILLLAEFHGVNGVAASLSVSAVLQSLISRTFMIKELRRHSIERSAPGWTEEWRVLRDFALPALLASVLVTPAHWICSAMLATSARGYGELAIAGVAMQWFNMILFLPGVASRVVLPLLTQHVSSENHKDARRLLTLAMGANAVVALPVGVVVAVGSTWILRIYGTEFESGAWALVVAAMAAALVAVQVPVGNLLAARSRMWWGVLMNLGWASIYIGLTSALVGHGAVGMMGAMGIAYAVHAAWVFGYASRNLGGPK